MIFDHQLTVTEQQSRLCTNIKSIYIQEILYFRVKADKLADVIQKKENFQKFDNIEHKKQVIYLYSIKITKKISSNQYLVQTILWLNNLYKT